MDTSKLDSHKRQIRRNIRNFFLTASIKDMEAAKGNYEDEFSKSCLDEMIEECRVGGVEKFGELPL